MTLTWQQSIGTSEEHLTKFDYHFLIHIDIENDLRKLCHAAKDDGVEISIISSYRSFDKQLLIWNEKWQGYRPVFSRHGRPLNVNKMSNMEKYKAISLWSALPGLSRHHWGTDLDIFCADAIKKGYQVELIPAEFYNKGVCEALNIWMSENLEKYGFFRPYQTYQQGVSEEPWHISHRSVSKGILEEFPFEQCLQQLNLSEIQSKSFICDIFEHYQQQYFCNICE